MGQAPLAQSSSQRPSQQRPPQKAQPSADLDARLRRANPEDVRSLVAMSRGSPQDAERLRDALSKLGKDEYRALAMKLAASASAGGRGSGAGAGARAGVSGGVSLGLAGGRRNAPPAGTSGFSNGVNRGGRNAIKSGFGHVRTRETASPEQAEQGDESEPVEEQQEEEQYEEEEQNTDQRS